MKNIQVAVFVCASSICAFATMAVPQKQTSQSRQTAQSSKCSNVVASNGSTVNLRCTDLTPDQIKNLERLPAILNKLLAMQLSVGELNQRFEEISKELSKPAQVINGDNNVVGNVVTGDGNIVGNNNQLNVGRYPRRTLPIDALSWAVPYLKKMPGKILIMYEQGDGEPYYYASQIADLFRSAQWTVEGPRTVLVVSNGPPPYGIAVGWHGDKLEPGSKISVNDSDSAGLAIQALYKLQNGKDFIPDREPTTPADQVMVTVHPSPLSRPK